MEQAGFSDVKFLGKTNFQTSQFTGGAYFEATKIA